MATCVLIRFVAPVSATVCCEVQGFQLNPGNPKYRKTHKSNFFRFFPTSMQSKCFNQHGSSKNKTKQTKIQKTSFNINSTLWLQQS